MRRAPVFAPLAGLLAMAGALAMPAGAAATKVTVDTDSASIETLQDLGIRESVIKDRNDDDFFRFTENLIPPKLSGPEGTASAFASQASTIVTAQNPPFPVAPVFGIGVDGRALAHAKKGAGDPGVPVSDPNGSFSADFETDGSTPFQFSGALNTSDDDRNDCASITVDLTGPFSRSFAVSAGGGCDANQPNDKGFVVEDDLPAGSYTLDVEYDAEVDPEELADGTETARAAVDVGLSFFPPETKITSSNINGQQHKAKFRFSGTGKFNGFECSLVRKRRPPNFRNCDSPAAFDNLRRGKYKFEVRALGRGGPDATPAKHKFRIP